MTLNISRVRNYLKGFEFKRLFIEELGWDHHSEKFEITVANVAFILESFAHKRGVKIFRCYPDDKGNVPNYSVRRKIENQLAKLAYEHLIIFTNSEKTLQIWQWVSRQPGLRAACREHSYYPINQSGDSLIQKLDSISFELSEEERLSLSLTVFRLKDAFDRDRLTKKFYDKFKVEQKKFFGFIDGISNISHKSWYASLMLNRLMFVYFIQKKGFLDGDKDYLKNRLLNVQKLKGKDQFLSFYRYFLIILFQEGFSKQPHSRQLESDLKSLIGNVPYLNGGIFEQHELEYKYPQIDIPDNAFERIFSFFDQYEWHLDYRPLYNDNEINPDVLGYIFEKYINQKAMGAYYTKEDITEYISKNAIIPYLFDSVEKECSTAFEAGAEIWRMLQENAQRYIHANVSKGVIDPNGDVIPPPDFINKGASNISQRRDWNQLADHRFGLQDETWREFIARRIRCLGIRDKLQSGNISKIDDFLTFNLDIRQFAEDAISNCETPELLRAFYKAITSVTVLDPTCGSGAFLFAALNILEPLYDCCIERMQSLIEDSKHSTNHYSVEKFKDFEEILGDIQRHPSRSYYILKSIIINNLYGVDIMAEAVEICKLRLFLKLAAQVDESQDLEPLPDIDFNIRCGNTLVGFLTRDQIRFAAQWDSDSKQSQGRLLFGETKNAIENLEEKADIVDRVYRKFRQMQTAYDVNANDCSSQKRELREKLTLLTEELNLYLANEYGIKPGNSGAFIKWLTDHQPLHWFVEYHGIMRRGGFDVIIGNPPYVEYRKVKKEYSINGFDTLPCGNLYAFTIERSLDILSQYGRLGLIVPLSIATTKRMKPLQELIYSKYLSWLSHYDVYPSKLFEGAKQRLTIMMLKKNVKKPLIYTSRYYRWKPKERAHLFSLIYYNKGYYENQLASIPKIEGSIGLSILEQLNDCKPANVTNVRENPSFYVHRIPYNYIKAMDFVPYFWNEIDGQKKSEDYKPYRVHNPKFAEPLLAIMNSNLFFWWWYCLFEGYHCGKHEICSFPVGLEKLSSKNLTKLKELSILLMEDLKKNKNRKTCNYKTTGKVVYDEFFPRYSKSIIDKIDKVLGDHFGFNDEQVDYLINYDFKFRIGK